MPKTRPPYSPEFQRQVVDLVRAGRDPADLAREFEPSAQAIRNWVVQADRQEGRREAVQPAALTATERDELARLRRHGPGCGARTSSCAWSATFSMARLEPIHGALADKELLPCEHLVDAGYVSAGHLVQAAQRHGIALIGPGRKDVSWQRRTPGAFQASDFAVAWEERRVRCPEGKESVRWGELENAARGRYVKVRFRTEWGWGWGSPGSVDTDDAFARGVPYAQDPSPVCAGVPASDH